MVLWINVKKGWKKFSLIYTSKILLEKQESVLVMSAALALLTYSSEFTFVQEKRKYSTVPLRGHRHSRLNRSFMS